MAAQLIDKIYLYWAFRAWDRAKVGKMTPNRGTDTYTIEIYKLPTAYLRF